MPRNAAMEVLKVGPYSRATSMSHRAPIDDAGSSSQPTMSRAAVTVYRQGSRRDEKWRHVQVQRRQPTLAFSPC